MDRLAFVTVVVIALVGCGHVDVDVAADSSTGSGPVAPEIVAPVKISASLMCTAGAANLSPQITSDAEGGVFAVFMCGASAQFVMSRDRGKTYGPPVDLSLDLPAMTEPISEVAIARGPDDLLYAAMISSNNGVFFRVSPDRGASWGTATDVGPTGDPNGGLSLVAAGDSVYLGIGGATSGVAVARNQTRGSGAFTLTQVDITAHFYHVLYDSAVDKLVVASDNPQLYVSVSSDAGATFAPAIALNASEFDSAWAASGGNLYTSGTDLTGGTNAAVLYVIPTLSPLLTTAISGLPLVTASQVRSVAADAAGNVFIASQLDDGSLELDRLTAGSATFDKARSIAPSGEKPIVAPLADGTGAVVLFTLGTQEWTTVQPY